MEKGADDRLPNQQFNGLLAEYNTLRSEILKRIEIRNTIVFGTLTFAGVLLSFGLTTPTLALIYPMISMFLAAAWVQSDVLVSELGRYIREELEHPDIGLQWETYRHQSRIVETKTWKFRPTVVFSTGGIFLITQTVALLIAFSKFQIFTILEWILSGVAIICLLLTTYFFQISYRRG